MNSRERESGEITLAHTPSPQDGGRRPSGPESLVAPTAHSPTALVVPTALPTPHHTILLSNEY